MEQLHVAGDSGLEGSGVLEEERPRLGEEQAETAEVHLLQVGFHLRKVGVVGQIERQARRQRVLDVEPEVVVFTRAVIAAPVKATQRIRGDLQVAPLRRHFDPVHDAGERQAEHAELAGYRRPVRDLVVAPDDPCEVDAPGLHIAGAVAQRLERDREFRAPTGPVLAGTHFPDRAPVPVGELAGHLTVVFRPDRVGAEDDARKPRAIGVEHHAERVGLEAVVGHGDGRRVGLVADHADVQRLVGEAEVDLRALRCRRAVVGLELAESGERVEATPRRVVHHVAVQRRRLFQAHGVAVRTAIRLGRVCRAQEQREKDGDYIPDLTTPNWASRPAKLPVGLYPQWFLVCVMGDRPYDHLQLTDRLPA